MIWILYLKNKRKKFNNYQLNHRKSFKTIKNRILKELTFSLNKLHKRKYSISQWRILIGPWLNIALNIYFYYNFFSKHVSNKFKLKIKTNISRSFYPPLDYINFFKIINLKKNQLYFFNLIFMRETLKKIRMTLSTFLILEITSI